jgi:hypothetical protein
VVQAARAGALQRGGRLAHDPAGLLGGEAAVGEDRGDRASAVEGLLDDERDRVVTADVEDPYQPCSSTPAARRAASSAGEATGPSASKQSRTTSRSRVWSAATHRS